MHAKYLGNNIDSIVYDYNVVGLLTGINKSYVAGTANHFFGMELGYDKTSSVAAGNTYLTPEFNGNIEGTVWKSAGDGINRKYDYTYDNANRLSSVAVNIIGRIIYLAEFVTVCLICIGQLVNIYRSAYLKSLLVHGQDISIGIVSKIGSRKINIAIVPGGAGCVLKEVSCSQPVHIIICEIIFSSNKFIFSSNAQQ